MPIAFPSVLLKPASWLLVGASAIFAPISAQAALFNWSVSWTPVPVTGNLTVVTLTGSGTLDATIFDVAQGIWQINSISGTYGGQTITGLVTSFQYTDDEGQTFRTVTSLNQFQEQGDPDFRFMAPAGQQFGFKTSLRTFIGTGQNGGLTGNDGTTSRGYDPSILLTSLSDYSSTITLAPGPLAFLGLPAVLFYSRKIKNRINQRSLAPIAD